ncbi:MAG: alpha/beta fold hydrolase [Solirubrobacteraceae bacterium]
MPEITPALYRAGSGEPLVLLHGFTGAWMHWNALLPGLSERYEVIAPTLHGHEGGRPYPLDSPMTFAGSADALEAHLDELGVGTAHMVGNSMGGALALELAKRGRARSVVALAPAGGWNEGDGEARRLAGFFARQQRITQVLAPRMPLLLGRPKLRRLAMRDIMKRGERVPKADALQLVEVSLGCTVADRAIEALRADRGLTLGDLDRISCPVLLATPQFDRVLPPSRHTARYRREIPGVEPVELAGCGHVPMWDDTPLVLRTIVEFVDRHTPSAADGAQATSLASTPAAG